MRAVIVSIVAALLLAAVPARAQAPKRVALVIGNGAYQSLGVLDNPRLDAEKVAALLDANGFDVVRCDGQRPGCFDLTRDGLEAALETLRTKASGAELALVFYAGHGMEGRDGNVLAPIDTEVLDCAERALRRGVPLDELFKAVGGARRKIVILDACRDDPFAQCPPMRGARPASFAPLSAPESESFLLVLSTKPGQVALDGPAGAHSPYARALLQWLEKEPAVYFHDVLSHTAKEVIEATSRANFTQVPEMLARGELPAACLKGQDCVGDVRAVSMRQELEALKQEHARDQELAEIARDYLAAAEKERARRPLTEEERKQELQRLKEVSKGVSDFMLEAAKERGRPFSREEEAQTLAGLMDAGRALLALNDTRAERALERLKANDETEAERLFAEDAAAREQAALMAEARAVEENRKAAQSLRHLAAIARPKNVAKAADTYKKATLLDPADAQTWIDYGRAASAAGRKAEAEAAYEQADVKARESNNLLVRYRAAAGLGAVSDGAAEEQHYRAALALAEEGAKADPDNPAWQRALSVAHCNIGNMLLGQDFARFSYVRQGEHTAALESFHACRAIAERLANADPGNSDLQINLTVTHILIGDVLRHRGDLADALASNQTALGIAEPRSKAESNKSEWLTNLYLIHSSISDVQKLQGDLAGALASSQTALAIVEELARSDPSNAIAQGALATGHMRMGSLLQERGDRSGALASYRAELAIREHRAGIDPANSEVQGQLAFAHQRIGRALLGLGDHDGALESYRQTSAIYQRLVASDPTDGNRQTDVAFVEKVIGELLRSRGDLVGALASFRAAIASYGKADSSNAGAQANLASAHSSVGQILDKQGDLAGALASYRAMQGAAGNATRIDPGMALFQSGLSLSHDLIAGVLVKQGKLADALASYRASLAVDEALFKSDPDNAKRQQGVASDHDSIGRMLSAQGDLAGALASFQAALAINERLASAEPDNGDRQSRLWASHIAVGDVLHDQRHLADALAHHGMAQDIAERRSKADPGSSVWQSNLAWSYVGVAGVRLAKGDRTGALALWRKALAIAEASAMSIEQNETKSAGKPGANTAGALGGIAWRALLARDPRKALAASERAGKLAPDFIWPDGNRAHALLFLGRPREARALYLVHKGKVTLAQSWERVVAQDFRTLRRAGLARPMMREVEVALGVAPAQSSQPAAPGSRKAAK